MAELINEKAVAGLPAPPKGNKVHFFSGAMLQGKKAPSGFGVRVTKAGQKSFVLFYRRGGRQHLQTVGPWKGNNGGGRFTVLQGIIAANELSDRIFVRGDDPRPQRTRRKEDGEPGRDNAVNAVLDLYLQRRGKDLRRVDVVRSVFDRLVRPAIGAADIHELKRSHIIKMLDGIADENGPVMAERCKAYLGAAFNWYQTRDEDFTSPIVRGLTYAKTSERARDRILDDDEIRTLWAALPAIQRPRCSEQLVKFLLLTATRRAEAMQMRWDEISHDGTWTIPGRRYKTGKDHVIPLTLAMRELIGKPPADTAKFPYVFSAGDGSKPFSRDGDLMKVVRGKMKSDNLPDLPSWRLHDLRRTARSLMSRAGVPSDHAERALGHVMGGIRGTYDRHEYLEEKKKAFEALDALLDRILKPTDKVTELAAHRKAGAQ
jgi:hypothetical protein